MASTLTVRPRRGRRLLVLRMEARRPGTRATPGLQLKRGRWQVRVVSAASAEAALAATHHYYTRHGRPNLIIVEGLPSHRREALTLLRRDPKLSDSEVMDSQELSSDYCPKDIQQMLSVEAPASVRRGEPLEPL